MKIIIIAVIITIIPTAPPAVRIIGNPDTTYFKLALVIPQHEKYDFYLEFQNIIKYAPNDHNAISVSAGRDVEIASSGETNLISGGSKNSCSAIYA